MPLVTPPSQLTAVADTGAAQISLSWVRTCPGTFNLYRSTSTGTEAPPAIASGITDTSYTDTPPGSGTYFYTATTISNSMESFMSNETLATI